METRTIGSLEVSVVGLGCNNFGMRIGHAETKAVVDAALDAGINFFDTADIYGGTKSETYLGEALGSRRDDIVLATQVRSPLRGPRGRGRSAAYIRTAVEDSLTRLGTDRIDLYQQHVPDDKTPIAETIGALVELVAEGKVREFGCSNFTVDMLNEAAAATPDGSPGFVSVQNQYNIFYREPEDGVLEWCDSAGVAFLPFFPLASGLLSGKYRAGEPRPRAPAWPPWATGRPASSRDERLAAVADLDELAEREGHTVLDLAFGWLLSRPAVASVIAGATRPEQVTANVRAERGARTPPCWRRSTPSRRARGTGASGAAGPRRRQVDQHVVGDERDREVHRHEHQHGLRRLPLLPDVEVRQPEYERHHDGQAEEQPRGAELTRATTGQAAQAMSTPMTVNLA